MSYPERVAYDYLTNLGVRFEHQKKVGKYYPDFLIGDTIIEIDGARWHNQDKDKERDGVLNELGYTVYRIDSKEFIERRIEQILTERGSLADR